MEGFLKQSTAVNISVLMIDSSDHITGKTGLSAGLTIYATKAAGTPATITPTVTELDATNVKGLYKLALTTGHTDTLGEFQLHITASGADPTDIKWQVSTYLPGEAATLQADQAVNATKFGGTTVTGRDIGASVLLSAGTGAGQLDFTSGIAKSNLTQILGTTLTETAGQIAAAFKKLFDVAAPVLTATSVNQTGDNYARLGAPAGASVSADVAAVKALLPTALAADGSIKASVQSFLGTAFTEGAAGRIAAAFKQFFNIATPAATMDHLVLVDTVTTYTGNTPQTGDAYARLGAPAGASVSADMAAVKVDTAAIKAKTDNLPSDPADASDIAGAFSTVNSTLATIAGYVDTEVAAIKSKTDLIPAAPAAVSDIPSAASIASAVMASVVEGSTTLLQMLRGFAAALLGKASGLATSTAVYRDTDDTKDRITATVDADGNRVAVTLDLN